MRRYSVTATFAISTALLCLPAAASACPNYTRVKAFHGYVIVDFHKSVSAPDGQGGIEKETLDRGTGVIRFAKLTPVYYYVGPRGHRRKLLVAFTGKATSGVMTVDDSYVDTGNTFSGTQTADGKPHFAKATIGVASFSGCKYGLLAGFDIYTKSSGNWPYGPGDFHPEGGVSILAESPAKKPSDNLHLHGTAAVRFQGDSEISGYFGTTNLHGSSDGWETQFGEILKASGQPDPTASIQWNFAPN